MGLFGFNKSKQDKLPWESLEQITDISKYVERSKEVPVLIYKHSTRCGVSSMALNRIESEWTAQKSECELVFLDLIAFRSVSNAVSEELKVQHQSPQAILLKGGEVVYHASHSGIDVQHMLSLL